jgi:hypothetical protein
MNMWRSDKSPVLTAERLLGSKFYAGLPAAERPAGVFATRAEWDKHKADIETMARFHSKVLRQLRAGKRLGKVIAKFREAGPPGDKT